MRSKKIATFLMLSLSVQAFAERIYQYKPELRYIEKKYELSKIPEFKLDSLTLLRAVGQLMVYPRHRAQNFNELKVGDKQMQCQVSPQKQVKIQEIEGQFDISNWNRLVKSRHQVVPLMAKDNNPVSMKIAMLNRNAGSFSVVTCKYLNPDGKSQLSIDDVSTYLATTYLAASTNEMESSLAEHYFKSKRIHGEYSFSLDPSVKSASRDQLRKFFDSKNFSASEAGLSDSTAVEASDQTQQEGNQTESRGNSQ